MIDKCIYNYTCEVLMDLYSLDASPAELVKSQTKVNYTKLDSENYVRFFPLIGVIFGIENKKKKGIY